MEFSKYHLILCFIKISLDYVLSSTLNNMKSFEIYESMICLLFGKIINSKKHRHHNNAM